MTHKAGALTIDGAAARTGLAGQPLRRFADYAGLDGPGLAAALWRRGDMDLAARPADYGMSDDLAAYFVLLTLHQPVTVSGGRVIEVRCA